MTTPKENAEIPSAVCIEFTDVNHGYKKRRITIRNPHTKEQTQALTEEDTRGEIIKIINLGATCSAAEATRFGTRYLQEHSFIQPEKHGEKKGKKEQITEVFRRG